MHPFLTSFSKSLPVKFQQMNGRGEWELSSWTELSGTDKKPSRTSVAQNHINRFKSILQKSETTHHSSATINTSIKLSPTRRSVSGQSKRPRRQLWVPDAPNYVFHENRLINMRKMQAGCKIDGNLANDAETWYNRGTNKPVLVRQRYAVVL